MRYFMTIENYYFSHNIIKGTACRFSINCSAAITILYWSLRKALP